MSFIDVTMLGSRGLDSFGWQRVRQGGVRLLDNGDSGLHLVPEQGKYLFGMKSMRQEGGRILGMVERENEDTWSSRCVKRLNS